jgi:hypothetical protein
MWTNLNFQILLVGTQNGAATLENSVTRQQKKIN